MKKLTGPLLIAGSPEKVPDLLYATGFSAVDPVVYLQDRGRRWLVVPLLEAGRARRQAKKGVEILIPAELVRRRSAQRRRDQWILALLRRARARRVTVPGYFPVDLVRRLERRGIRVRVAPGSVFPEREVKDAAELRRLRLAQRAAIRAMRRAVGLLRRARARADGLLELEGRVLTSERVRHEIDTTLLEHDCIATETIAAGGTQGADPHERGRGPLRAGEPIVIDIFPRRRADGYWGDLTRTVVRGQASPAVRKMHEAVRRAQRAALRGIRAGAAVAPIHRAAQRALEAAGFATAGRGAEAEGFIHNTGHGVGLEIHEGPIVGDAPGRLRAGHVITVEPGLYYRRHGGVRIEDTIVVTAKGSRPLARCPDYFEL
ncbi:MAG TPA: M24 family metallopeptidase [Kiritimatiellia bacterium]|nr:M24 family metallopeptidase [Kiritimatiellia bacterium]HRZ12810.1 M24 family metallopeptidase [Kiritimatiellia bacterium]HSA18238.1 M24 family metallopeptidase [Kiritimatiellia bacterium]